VLALQRQRRRGDHGMASHRVEHGRGTALSTSANLPFTLRRLTPPCPVRQAWRVVRESLTHEQPEGESRPGSDLEVKVLWGPW
jgi:hypothetical protein